jgi:hypothetical protein
MSGQKTIRYCNNYFYKGVDTGTSPFLITAPLPPHEANNAINSVNVNICLNMFFIKFLDLSTYFKSTFRFKMDDSTSPSTQNVIFDSKNELLQHVREFYRCVGIAITTQRSQKDEWIILQCDRGGEYRGNGSENAKRQRTSRRIGCPFRLKGVRHISDNKWHLNFICLNHNHVPSENMTAHPTARQLTDEQTKRIELLSNAGVAPRKVKAILRNESEKFCSTSKDIYNAKAKIKVNSLGDLSSVEVILNELTTQKYIIDYLCDEENRLISLLFAHEQAVQSLLQFNSVLLMDSTYKTNRFCLPLLHIIGINCCYRTVTIALVFMSDETEKSYKWALNSIKKCSPICKLR